MMLNDPTLLKTQCYIDGAWIGGGDTPVTNPATGAEIARVPELGAAEAKSAIEAAHRAFASWSRSATSFCAPGSS